MQFHKVAFALALTSLVAACSSGNVSSDSSALPPLGQRTAASLVTLQFNVVHLPSNFSPRAIMKGGEIPGAVGNTAAVYQSGAIHLLEKYNGASTVAQAVNSFGVVVGYSYSGGTMVQHALKFFHGTIENLGAPPTLIANQPTAISDCGDIYGSAWANGQSESGYQVRYRPGNPQVITNPSQGRGYIPNVNGRGTFAYSWFIFGTDVHTAYRGKGLSATPIASRYPWSTADWINDAGTIAGSVSKAASAPFVPAIAYYETSANVLHLLPMLRNVDDMEPKGINSSGTIVGNAYDSSSAVHRFSSLAALVMRENSLVATRLDATALVRDRS